MAGPCQVLLDLDSRKLAKSLVRIAADEAWRVEKKFSRYRTDNIVHKMNTADGRCVCVDDETSRLLAYADQCYRLSGGLFDITSGVLRRVWRFDGGDRVPDSTQIGAVLPLVGWDKVKIHDGGLTMPAGMELDFGGIGKEYATDSALKLMKQSSGAAMLVNFGGDLAGSGPRRDGLHWQVGIECPENEARAVKSVPLQRGALATSGDARRFLKRDGVRLSHVLNPFTGWPIEKAPRSVTVAARHCTEAGMLATFALLHGEDAEQFLEEQKTDYWVIRGDTPSR